MGDVRVKLQLPVLRIAHQVIETGISHIKIFVGYHWTHSNYVFKFPVFSV